MAFQHLALLSVGFLAWTWSAIGQTPTRARPLPTYAEWRTTCRDLPSNRLFSNRIPTRDKLPLASYADFAAVLDPVLDLCRTGALASARAWVGAAPGADTFYNLETGYYLQPTTPFQPFAERHKVAPGTRVLFHGDLHGDIHSLLTYLDALQRDGTLDGFRITQDDIRIAFLGDYTDRGRYGVEVLYTLLRLKLANPDQVLLVRGNHEDVSLVARYGFLAEVQAKYGREFDIRRTVRFYDFLPAVLYLASGTNVIQCNHGGLEPGYDPSPLLDAPAPAAYHLLGRLNQRRFLTAQQPWVGTLPSETRRMLEASLTDFQPQSPIAPTVLGFMWNDFTVLGTEPQFAVDPGRAFVYGEQSTRLLLDMAQTPKHRIRAVFRAHQHAGELNPMMRRLVASRGIYRHWQTNDHTRLLQAEPAALRSVLETTEARAIPDGSVWTFNVSPDSVYGAGCGFTFDTAGDLTVAERWEDWRLRVINHQVTPSKP
jgi:hypothetical protein